MRHLPIVLTFRRRIAGTSPDMFDRKRAKLGGVEYLGKISQNKPITRREYKSQPSNRNADGMRSWNAFAKTYVGEGLCAYE